MLYQNQISQTQPTTKKVSGFNKVIVLSEGCVADIQGITAGLSESAAANVAAAINSKSFEGKWNTFKLLSFAEDNSFTRILLLGAGNVSCPEKVRELGVIAGETLAAEKVSSAEVSVSAAHLQNAACVLQLALGLDLGVYAFPKALSATKGEDGVVIELGFAASGLAEDELKSTLEVARVIAKETRLCRTLQDCPPNIATPEFVAKSVADSASDMEIKASILTGEELMEKGFKAMMSVGKGSCHDPRLLTLEYAPAQATKTIAFVGKGLTFDTGGYNVKVPYANQKGMKFDMSGAAMVVTAVKAIAQLKLPIKVYGVAALAENMIDAHAYRPDDVVESYSGKTIEVHNTDAEGRIVLSDALAYAEKDLKADAIYSVATLTGAAIMASGHFASLNFTADAELNDRIKAAATASGHRSVAVPLFEESQEHLKSTVADLTNITPPNIGAGSSTAASFLTNFVEKVPYAHIDVAGVASEAKAFGFPKKGGSSGYGVQLLVEIAKQTK